MRKVFLDDLTKADYQSLELSNSTPVRMLRQADQKKLMHYLEYAFTCWKVNGQLK
jgi:hypothetical protein